MKTNTTAIQLAAPFRVPSPVPSLLWGDVAFLGLLFLGALMIVNFRRGR